MKSFGLKEQISTAFNSHGKLFIALLCVAIIVLGGFVLLWPQFNQLQSNGVWQYKETLRKRDELVAYLQKVQAMKKTEEELTFRAWQNLYYVLPQNEEVYLLFAQMEALAKENSMILTSVNINDSEQTATPQAETVLPTEEAVASLSLPAEIKTVTLNVNLISSDSDQQFTYDRFKKFLDSLENNIRLIDINSITYSPDKTLYTFTFTTYYFSESELTPSTAEANVPAVEEEPIIEQ